MDTPRYRVDEYKGCADCTVQLRCYFHNIRFQHLGLRNSFKKALEVAHNDVKQQEKAKKQH